MRARLAFACMLASVTFLAAPSPIAAHQQGAAAQEGQEKPKVPKDSIMAVLTGCIRGRVIRASDVRQTDTTSGVNITGRTFRISGKRNVMDAVKQNDGQRVEMTGLIKKSALIEPGMKFKGGRVIVGGSTGSGPNSIPSPAENVVVIDALTVTAVGGSCEG